jgi:Type II secretion system (T2SS), protein M subtype b
VIAGRPGNKWRNNIWLRRGLFVLVNGGALAGLLCFLVWPVQGFFTDREADIAQQRAMLARFVAIAAQRATVADLAKATPAGGTEFLQGGNDGVATANLQTLVKGLVEPTGAHLRSVRAAPAKLEEDLKFIGVQVEITGTIEAIYQTVRAVEAAKPLLFITGALLRPTQQAAVGPRATSAVPTIDAHLDIAAAMQIGADK